MKTDAEFYDGESAGFVPATLTLTGTSLRYEAGGLSGSAAATDISIVPPVGKGAWIVELERGASLRFRNEEFANRLQSLRGDPNLLRRLEGAWHWALIALVVAVVSAWMLLTYGVPVAARYVAFAIPDDANRVLRDDSLRFLDRVLFKPSEVPEDTRGRIQQLFAEVTRTDAAHANYRLEFRHADIGANALAIPGGIVVITDEMIKIAESDEELLAVLAHEVGHLHHRHSFRILLQNSASALIIAGVTGDLSSLTALSATVPTVLMQTKYSRDFEREADEFAFEFLESKGISSNVLSQLLVRIEASAGGGDLPDWISTHPQSEERVPAEPQ